MSKDWLPKSAGTAFPSENPKGSESEPPAENSENTAEAAPSPNTAGVGASGLPGGPAGSNGDDASPPASARATESLAASLAQIRQIGNSVLVGATGGIGGQGDPSPEALCSLFQYQLASMDLKTLVLQFRRHHDLSLKAFSEADTSKAAYALVLGMFGNEAKARVKKGGKEKWSEYAAREFSCIKPRSLQKYMRFSLINGVCNHLGLGIEKLDLFASIIPKAERTSSPDPITDFLTGYGIQLEEIDTLAELKTLIEASTAHRSLVSHKIQADYGLVKSVFESGYRLENRDYTALALVRDTPEKVDGYLKGLIEHDGDRNALLGLHQDERARQRIGNVNKSAQVLADVLKTVLDSERVEGVINLEVFDILVDRIEALRHRVSNG